MEKKFTPGPWEACHNGKCKCRQVLSIPGDVPVFTAKMEGETSAIGLAHHEWGDSKEMIYGEIPEEQTQANAILIASAPDMLEALEELVKMYDSAMSEITDSIDRNNATPGSKRMDYPEEQLQITKAKAVISKAYGK